MPKTEEPKIEEIDSDSSDGEMESEEKTSSNVDSTKQKQNRAETKSRKAVQKMGFKSVSGINRVTIKKSKNILFVISKPDVYKAPGGGSDNTYVVFGEAKIEDMAAQHAAHQRAMGSRGMGGRPGGMGGPGGPGGMDMGMMRKMMEKCKELGIDPSKGNVDPAKMAEVMKAMGMNLPGMGGMGMPGAPGAGPAAGGGMDKIEEGDEEAEEAGSSTDKKDESAGSSGDAAAPEPEEKDIELVTTQVGCSKEDAIAALKKNKNDIVEAIMSFSG